MKVVGRCKGGAWSISAAGGKARVALRNGGCAMVYIRIVTLMHQAKISFSARIHRHISDELNVATCKEYSHFDSR